MKKIELSQQIKFELAQLNDSYREKLCFTQFNLEHEVIEIETWLLLTFFRMFTHSPTLYL